jgi:hypothetical protein
MNSEESKGEQIEKQNSKRPEMFSMKPRTWAMTSDQKYAYVYVPDPQHKAIEIRKIPSFEKLASEIRYELPGSITDIKILLIDDITN